MKSRRIHAIVTAVAMILLPTQAALAADETTTGGSVITGDAIVDYVDPANVIRITVPTSEALQFTLDPQHLAATQGVGSWDPSAGGFILPAAVGIFANKSAIPIKTTVDFTLEDDATTVEGETGVVLLESDDDVNTGTDKNMFLSFVPANKKTTIAMEVIGTTTAPEFVMNGVDAKIYEADDLTAAELASAIDFANIANATFGQFVETAADAITYNQVVVPIIGEAVPATVATTVAEYNADGEAAIAVPAAAAVMTDAVTGTSLAYAMNKADYYVLRGNTGFSLVYDDGTKNDNYDTASFVISGLINKNADWSDYKEAIKISLTATYSFENLTDAAYLAAEKIATTYNSVATIAPVPPSISAESSAIEAATAEAVTVSLGAGSSAATGIESITYEDSGTKTVEPTNYALDGTTLTFTSTYIDSLIEDAVTSREYTITFNNTDATTDTYILTYTAPNSLPNISTTGYTIQDNTALNVTVDLGTGTGAATGITSITYINSSSVQKTLESTFYSLSGTTLTFTSDYIHGVYAAITEPRTYTITFNDTAATVKTITMSK